MLKKIWFLIPFFFMTIICFANDYGEVLKNMEDLGTGYKVQAVENLLYTKHFSLEVTPSGGYCSSDPYVDMIFYGLALAFHLNDLMGVV